MWKPISEFDTTRSPSERVDLWIDVPASLRSMGMSDTWRVVDAYYKDGKWWHFDQMKQRELVSEYVTHFMERPAGPCGSTEY